MTPELKTACEVVFQEHKGSSQPIKWNSDTFRGRISLGLSDLAKDTLVKKNIIILPNKSKKIITQLNPLVASASSFEEAEDMIKNRDQVLVADLPVYESAYSDNKVSVFHITASDYTHDALVATDNISTQVAEIKWYMKPVFYYVIWPLCALVAGAAISYLIDLAYTELFLNLK